MRSRRPFGPKSPNMRHNMEFLRRMKTDEDSEGETHGEIVNYQMSDDGRFASYDLRMPDGSIKAGFAIPTRHLGVRFTADGPIELAESE